MWPSLYFLLLLFCKSLFPKYEITNKSPNQNDLTSLFCLCLNLRPFTHDLCFSFASLNFLLKFTEQVTSVIIKPQYSHKLVRPHTFFGLVVLHQVSLV